METSQKVPLAVVPSWIVTGCTSVGINTYLYHLRMKDRNFLHIKSIVHFRVPHVVFRYLLSLTVTFLFKIHHTPSDILDNLKFLRSLRIR